MGGPGGGPGGGNHGERPAEAPRDPLVIDLNGDGIQVTALDESTVFFDLGLETGDGQALRERTQWVGADDAFLVVDANGNGRVDDIEEMFGNADVDGFAELATYDTNSDGVVDSSDDDFSSLQLWVDADQDGVTDEGELRGLASEGVLGITLVDGTTDRPDEGGVGATSTALLSDGSARTVGDVWFRTDPTRTSVVIAEDHAFTQTSLLLPSLTGYGRVADLLYAVSESPALERQVRSLVDLANGGSVTSFMAAFEDMLLTWSGAAHVEEGTYGAHADARQMAALDAFFGVPIGTHPSAAHAAELSAQYRGIVESMAARFLMQAPLSAGLLAFQEAGDEASGGTFAAAVASSNVLALSMLRFNAYTDQITASAEELEAAARWLTQEAGGDLGAMLDAGRLLRLVYHDFTADAATEDFFRDAVRSGSDVLVGAFNASDFLLAMASGAVLEGADGADILSGAQETQLLEGRGGDDELDGRGGDDIYVYALGDGADHVEDHNGTDANDVLVLRGISVDEVTVATADRGLDAVLTFADGGSVRLNHSLYHSSQHWGVDFIQFDDGTVWDQTDLENARVRDAGTADAEIIFGYGDRGDVMEGRGGDDELDGRGGDDTYVYALGDGSDHIEDHNGADANDVLVLRGIAADEVTVSTADRGLDAVLTFSDGGSVRLNHSFYHATQHWGVDFVRFDDGTVWNQTDLENARVRDAGTAAAESIHGYDDRSDTIRGRGGDDALLDGRGGDDIYVYALGDGADHIEDHNGTDANDVLVLHGIVAGEVTVTTADRGLDAVLNFVDGGSVRLNHSLYHETEHWGVDFVHFDDGTVWSQSDMEAMLG